MNQTDNVKNIADVSGSFFRAKTRVELFEALSKNIKCEEQTCHLLFVSKVLNSIIYYRHSDLKYIVYPSMNEGWSVYESVS